jgi:hypothetical protein
MLKHSYGKIINIDDSIMLGISPLPNGHKFTYAKTDKPLFKYDYARIGTFLTSKCRSELSSAMFPIKENVYRFHTDGFISSVLAPHLHLGTKIGNWKLNEGTCKVKNCMDVDWTDKN